jgi:hypothetical protein
MWHAWGRGKVFRGFWLGGPKVRDHWEDLGVGGRITRYTVMNLRVPYESRIFFGKLSDNQLFK